MKTTIETDTRETVEIEPVQGKVSLRVSHIDSRGSTITGWIDLTPEMAHDVCDGIAGAANSATRQRYAMEVEEPGPVSPWQIGGKVTFDRGIYKGRVLTITEWDEDEERFTLEGGRVTIRVTERDLNAGAKHTD